MQASYNYSYIINLHFVLWQSSRTPAQKKCNNIDDVFYNIRIIFISHSL